MDERRLPCSGCRKRAPTSDLSVSRSDLDGSQGPKKARCMLTRGTCGGGAKERPIFEGSRRRARNDRGPIGGEPANARLTIRDDSLTQPEEEKLRATLRSKLPGETRPAGWHATLNALAAMRRACEPSVRSAAPIAPEMACGEEW
jgi:hypothetical protein